MTNEIKSADDSRNDLHLQKPKPKPTGKTELLTRALSRKRGASLDELCQITGWQPHSVRGFISGTLRKKQNLNIVSNLTKSGKRRYLVIADKASVV